MTTQNALALEIASLTQQIKAMQDKLSERKADLIEQVGNGGATFETALGKITVTQQTEDRATGQYSYALDTKVFMTLDERVKANLIKQGVVSQSEKITRGQSPVVKVSAR